MCNSLEYCKFSASTAYDNWRLAIVQWNDSYNNVKIKNEDIPSQQPNYTTLESLEVIQKRPELQRPSRFNNN